MPLYGDLVIGMISLAITRIGHLTILPDCAGFVYEMNHK